MAQTTFIGNLRSAPVWAKDFGGRRTIAPFGVKVNASLFTDQAGVPVTVATGGAAQGATSIPIVALNYAPTVLASTVLIAQGNVIIPAGTVLYFGGAKYASTTADAVYGATTLTVAALPTALVAGDTTTWSKYGTEFIPSGTFIGRTAADQAAGNPFSPANTAASGSNLQTELYVTMFDAANVKMTNDVEVYRHQGVIAINYLPGYANFTTADLAALNANYQCIIGVD